MFNVEVLSNEEYNKIKHNVERLLDKFDYEYTDDAIDKIINVWATDKKHLITAFKTHPNYVEGEFLIAYKQKFVRGKDTDAIYQFCNWLQNQCVENLQTQATLPEAIQQQTRDENCIWLPTKLYQLLTSDLYSYTEVTLTEEQAQHITEICPFASAHTGQKLTRVVNKICTYLKYNQHPDYNREYAKYADALSPIEIEKTIVLSINPMDYLTMSFGNSWASCHTIDKSNRRGMPNNYQGCYSSGTISYMLDGTSMVMYTVDEAYQGTEYYTKDKINRQMYHYDNETLIQGRLYPQSNDSDGTVYAPYRAVVQSIIAQIEGFENLWTMKRGTEAIRDHVISEGTHYRDYTSFDNCTISIRKNSEKYNNVVIGHDPICINCGYEHDREDKIVCHDCDEETYYCENCGAELNEDEVIWIDDEPYCSDCCFYCEACGKYFPNDEGHWIESEDRVVCDDCYDEYYTECADCGAVYLKDDMIYIDSEDDYVCRECCDEHYTRCEACGKYFPNDEVTEVEGEYVCQKCLENYTGICEDCGEVYHIDNMKKTEDGRWLCPDCWEKYEEELDNEEESKESEEK